MSNIKVLETKRIGLIEGEVTKVGSWYEETSFPNAKFTLTADGIDYSVTVAHKKNWEDFALQEGHKIKITDVFYKKVERLTDNKIFHNLNLSKYEETEKKQVTKNG